MSLPDNRSSAEKSSSFTQETGYALRIIDGDQDGGTIYEAIVLSESTQKPSLTIDSNQIIALSEGNPTGGQVMPVGDIVITASGTYQTYLKVGTAYLYQIQSLMWSYSETSSCNVQSARVQYGAGGTAYYINTLEIAQYAYSHVIESYVNYPSEGTLYSNFNNPCPYAIDIAVSSAPGSGGGMYFNCEVTIDGRSYSWH